MACGCGKSTTKSLSIDTKNNSYLQCSKCKSKMLLISAFDQKLKKYIKLWECSNKSCKLKVYHK